MDTSRPRTPPAPVSPGPEGRPAACRGKQKTSKSPFGFRRETENLSARTRAGNHSTRPCKPSPFH